jgi:hypothetical protein
MTKMIVFRKNGTRRERFFYHFYTLDDTLLAWGKTLPTWVFLSVVVAAIALLNAIPMLLLWAFLDPAYTETAKGLGLFMLGLLPFTLPGLLWLRRHRRGA